MNQKDKAGQQVAIAREEISLLVDLLRLGYLTAAGAKFALERINQLKERFPELAESPNFDPVYLMKLGQGAIDKELGNIGFNWSLPFRTFRRAITFLSFVIAIIVLFFPFVLAKR